MPQLVEETSQDGAISSDSEALADIKLTMILMINNDDVNIQPAAVRKVLTTLRYIANQLNDGVAIEDLHKVTLTVGNTSDFDWFCQNMTCNHEIADYLLGVGALERHKLFIRFLLERIPYNLNSLLETQNTNIVTLTHINSILHQMEIFIN